MGQYWIPVNLTKREFIDPSKLGSGLKLWEQLANHLVGAALVVLCAAQREVRGGGDLDMDADWHGPERTVPEHNSTPGPMPEDYPEIAKRTIGRWAGDRIALVGDYARRDDLPPEFDADLIYALCQPQEYIDAQCQHWENCPWTDDPETQQEYHEKVQRLRVSEPYRDITEDVRQVLEHELQVSLEP